ncbi:MAG: BolA/IbaG family iron-sulfur metabolism protein [Gammaproteobacteria bacterium]|nr:BolA/IbaG family iron-sulfur metabolism protein [Gammaproteobacteria bacterium]
MTTEEIENMLAETFTDASIAATGGDGSYQVRIVSDAFEGLNAVKRQQSVYRVLNPHIASGVIHAINMQLVTPGEADGD